MIPQIQDSQIRKLTDQIRKFHSVKIDFNYENRLILPFFLYTVYRAVNYE